jgi:hypothetical protein
MIGAPVADYLRIYMNDQLALGVLWREVARRSERQNAGTPTGEMLTRVANAIAEDVETFRALMLRLELRTNPVKTAAVVVGERIGRLKLNGRVRSYSPLSRYLELEFLAHGIEGKKVLWATLRDQAGLGERFPDVDFGELIRRAEDQRADVERFRVGAAADAFARR